MNTIKKVMIFDDDEDILSICTFILEEDGWEVQTFADCKNVVKRVTEFQPNVIIMDNWIPDEGGVTATREIKSRACTGRDPGHLFFS